ncbi:Non-specific serine/threonine protein kinase [Bertholletia excelsa]
MTAAVLIATAIILAGFFTPAQVAGLGGSAATVAVVYGSRTVCGIVAQQKVRRIQCWRDGRVIAVEPNVSFDFIAGGSDDFCGLRSGGSTLLCWDSSFAPKRLYHNYTMPLQDLTMGDDQICTISGIGGVQCWRGESTFSGQSLNGSGQFRSISSGLGFNCGVSIRTNRVRCWGGNTTMAGFIESQFINSSMSNIVVGGTFACGFNVTGFLICKGKNNSGQLDVPYNLAFEFSGVALGENHGCATRRSNGQVICWGGGANFSRNASDGVSFETVVAGLNFTCGLTTSNFSIICWGPGWPSDYTPRLELPLQKILPGPCVQSNCSDCGIFPESQILCSGSGNICKPCFTPIPQAPPRPTSPETNLSPSRGLTKRLLAFAIVGSIGAFAGLCSIVYCLWTGVCFGNKKIHNSVQPTITAGNSIAEGGGLSSNSPPSRSATIRRQASRAMRRQRSGASSNKHDRAEEFSFSDLAAATDNFSEANKIGAGSFGVVYRAKLWDGREVAIKRSENTPKTKKFQEKESAFESEIAFLSRLHHKHLVRLVGYCEDRDERLLVYEYMKNGALHDHLHSKDNVEKSSSFINSWKMRIKIALDAARGIEYLHNYAVPQIIHRDIKSSNILLDSNWTARVSDFGLSLTGPGPDPEFRPARAAGTVGYIDPEYYGLNVLTPKSDVYGLGVVLLELLTGKRAIFRVEDGDPTSVVEFAVPMIAAGEVASVLDKRVGSPEVGEAEAVELVSYTAVRCVSLEGKDRPTMSDIVANLERALALCGDSHGSISSDRISIDLD